MDCDDHYNCLCGIKINYQESAFLKDHTMKCQVFKDNCKEYIKNLKASFKKHPNLSLPSMKSLYGIYYEAEVGQKYESSGNHV